MVSNYSDDIDGESNNLLVGNITGLNFCQVSVTLTHSGTGDAVNNRIWLPLKEWNGRFLGVGGEGYAAGVWSLLSPAVQRGIPLCLLMPVTPRTTLETRLHGHWSVPAM